jgi:hypothetical protein
MKTIITLGMLLIAGLSLSPAGKQEDCPSAALNTCLSSALSGIAGIKPGMTRQDLLKVFEPSGGFYPSPGTYQYRKSPYIRIDVEFSPASGETSGGTQSARDVIKSVSRAYLAYPQYD